MINKENLTKMIKKEIEKDKENFISKEKKDFQDIMDIITKEFNSEYSYIIPDIVSGRFKEFFTNYILNSMQNEHFITRVLSEEYAQEIENACIKHILNNKNEEVIVNDFNSAEDKKFPMIFQNVFIGSSTQAFEIYKSWDIILSKVVMQMNNVQLSNLKLMAMIK